MKQSLDRQLQVSCAKALIMIPVAMAETATHLCEKILQKSFDGEFPLDEHNNNMFLQMTYFHA